MSACDTEEGFPVTLGCDLQLVHTGSSTDMISIEVLDGCCTAFCR
jgi:hypothetical protein